MTGNMPDMPQTNHANPALTVEGAGPNTKLIINYRDAANYKKSSTHVLEGALTSAGLAQMTSTMEDGTFFVPQQVGLPSLTPTDDYDDDLDHSWHSLGDASLTDEPADAGMSIGELLQAWATKGDEWDEGL